MAFDPKAMLAALAENNIRFVVIGGIAATAHASPYQTRDLDICPAPDEENLHRLSSVLEQMEAKVRVAGEQPFPIVFSPRVLTALPFLNLITKFGPLDVVHTPAGTTGYEDLNRDAVSITISGVEVQVASRLDILRSKEALRRDKDLLTIRILRELEEREIELRRTKGKGDD